VRSCSHACVSKVAKKDTNSIPIYLQKVYRATSLDSDLDDCLQIGREAAVGEVAEERGAVWTVTGDGLASVLTAMSYVESGSKILGDLRPA
jgi:hypothetical protein